MPLLAMRFIVELVGVAAAAWLGATAPVPGPARIALAIAAPLVLVAVWGVVVAPNASNPLSLRVRELLGTGILVAVAVVLALAGHIVPAIAYAAVVLADQALLLVLAPAFHPASRVA